MIPVRRAPTTEQNVDLREQRPRRGESNGEWLARTKQTEGLLLIGGASLSHFRLRVAQSHVRRDLLPSFWSMAGFLRDGGRNVDTVSFSWGRHASSVPATNAVVTRSIADYDDPVRYPNIAVVRFATDAVAVSSAIEQVKADRMIVDLPRLLVEWLGFVWGAGQHGNPLLARVGIPSACFVEAVYSVAGIELTPGLASEASCPEAIWQSLKWWRPFYEAVAKEERGRIPGGLYGLRQVAAAVSDEDGASDGRVPRSRTRSAAARRK